MNDLEITFDASAHFENAKVRHAQYFCAMLMTETPDYDAILADKGNIMRVINQVENGEVQSKYSAEQLRQKLEEVLREKS